MPAASSTSGGTPTDHGGARRLVAIAFVDIVGYSILMSEDEAGTHRRWMAHLTNVIRPGAERHRGRVVKSTGDGVLAEFPSALEAVEWAREVQEAVHRGETAEVRPIALRIAIHVGEVITTADDIYEHRRAIAGIRGAGRHHPFGGRLQSGPRYAWLASARHRIPESEEFRAKISRLRHRWSEVRHNKAAVVAYFPSIDRGSPVCRAGDTQRTQLFRGRRSRRYRRSISLTARCVCNLT